MRAYLGSFLALLPVLLLVALVWHALAAPPPSRLGASAAVPTPGIEVSDTTVIGWGRGAERGKKLWQVTARRISVSADQHLTSFAEITDGALYRDGRPEASIKAGSAVYDAFARSLLVDGGVEVRLAAEDARLVTQRLSWQEQSRSLDIPYPTTIETPDYHLQARHSRVDVRRAAIRADTVSGDLHGIHFTAAACDYLSRTRSLILAPVRLSCADWTLDAARARIDPRTGDLRAEHVHMSSTSPMLSLSPPGRSARTRLASGGLLVGLLASGAAAGPSPVPPKPEPGQTKTIDYDAKHIESFTRPDGTEVIILSDDVRFTQTDPKDPAKKMTLTADKVEATKQKDGSWTAVATGSPKAADDRSDVTGDKITMFLKERRAVTEGKVKIVTRPKETSPASPQAPSSASASAPPPQKPSSLRERVKGDVVITGKRAEYNYRQKNAVVEGDVVVTNKGRKLTTPKATYSDKTEIVTLSGPVACIDEKGQTANLIGDVQLSLKEGEEFLQSLGKNHVHGQLFIKEDEDEEQTASKPSQSPAAAPAKPGGGG